MRRAVLLAAFVTMSCGGAGEEDAGDLAQDLGTGAYVNPVIPMYDRPAGVAHDIPQGVPHQATEGCPDPQGLKTSSGDFFIYCTSYTFRFSRLNGFPVFKSKSRTLAGPWAPVGSIIPDQGDSRRAWPGWVKDANGARDGDFWGPDVHELPNGRFVAEYSAPCGAHRCVGIAWANGPDGPWTHAQEPFVTPANNADHAPGGDSYDPSLLVTAQGTYLYWVVPGRGVYGERVDYDAHGRLAVHAGARVFQIADRTKGQRGEGPYVVEHGGAFYEFYSSGSLLFSYYVGVRRGDRPDGPFTEEGPVVVQRNGRFVATGGNSVIQDAVHGTDVLVYHAIVVPPGGGCPREDPVYGGQVKPTPASAGDANPHCRVQGERQAMIDAIEWKTGAGGSEWPVLKNGTGTPSVGKTALP